MHLAGLLKPAQSRGHVDGLVRSNDIWSVVGEVLLLPPKRSLDGAPPVGGVTRIPGVRVGHPALNLEDT